MGIWLSIIIVLGAVLSFFPSFIIRHNLLWCFGVAIMLVSVGIGARVNFFREKAVGNPEFEKVQLRCRKLELDISHLKNVLAKMRSYDTEEFAKDIDLIRKLRERVEALESRAETMEKRMT